MSYTMYRNHRIESTAVYDIESGKWQLGAAITSPEGRARRPHIVANPIETFSRFEDADLAGVEAGKNWVDSYLAGRRMN